jgi:ligand-binding sensor domain-containing protein
VAIRNRNYLWLYNEQELLKHDSLSVKDAYITLPSDKEINGVIQDHNGNIWAGTTGYGVIKLNPLIKQFRSYLPKNSPSLLFQDRKGNTYFHNNYFSSFHFHRLNSTNNSMEGPLAVSGVQLGIYQDRHGHFWMINAQNNQLWLLKYSEDWQLLKQYVVPDGSCLMWAFVKMVEDRNGLLWLGLSCGKLVKFNPDKEQFSILNYQHLLPQQGALTQAYSLYQDHQQTFWIGTQHGLVRC